MTTNLPTPDSYWVIPGRLLAGEYPGAKDKAEALHKLARYRDAGITLFFDLTEAGEHDLRPYAAAAPGIRRCGPHCRPPAFPHPRQRGSPTRRRWPRSRRAWPTIWHRAKWCTSTVGAALAAQARSSAAGWWNRAWAATPRWPKSRSGEGNARWSPAKPRNRRAVAHGADVATGTQKRF
ncbi:MAG: hypothetical protein R2856_10465 [Caldilineaceae bacterium]